MKASQFITIMRKLIREEVRAAVKQELSVLTEALQPSKKVLSNKTPIKQKQTVKNYTGNPLIDEVLSETVVGRDFGSEGPSVTSDYTDFAYTSNDVPVYSDEQSSYDDLPQQVSDPAMPFMKNYSKLLEKADQISKNKF